MSDTNPYEFTQGDRLRKSLEVSGISSNDMAAHLHMSRTTVSNYLHGRTEPRVSIVRDWAEYTGAPVGWLLGQSD